MDNVRNWRFWNESSMYFWWLNTNQVSELSCYPSIFQKCQKNECRSSHILRLYNMITNIFSKTLIQTFKNKSHSLKSIFIRSHIFSFHRDITIYSRISLMFSDTYHSNTKKKIFDSEYQTMISICLWGRRIRAKVRLTPSHQGFP